MMVDLATGPAGESDEWGTNYAGHFLLEAQDKGYTVSDNCCSNGNYLKEAKQMHGCQQQPIFMVVILRRPTALYLLALAKAPELGAMNRLKEFKYLSPEAKWRLGCGLQACRPG